MKKAWNFIIDIADGILGAMLYGNQGGFLWTSTRAEAQNAQKLRRWAAGNGKHDSAADELARPSRHDDFDARMQRFRRETTQSLTPKD